MNDELRFPPPRQTRDAGAPYREAAPAPPPAAVPTIARRPATPPPATSTGRPHAPPPITDAALRREIVAASVENALTPFGSRAFFRGLLVAYPHWFGAVTIVVGVVLLAVGIAHHHVVNGPAAIFIGAGWVLCNRLPLDRPWLRLVAIALVMAAGIAFETTILPHFSAK